MSNELREAKKFIAKHGIGSLPGPRLENGESADRQRSAWLRGRDRARGTEAEPASGAKVGSYDAHEGGIAAFEQYLIEMGYEYQPLVAGGHASLEQLEKRARMQHVLGFLQKPHVDLLLGHYVEGRTQADLADEFEVSQQAVSKRLATAVREFKKAFGLHWNDPIDIDLSVEEA